MNSSRKHGFLRFFTKWWVITGFIILALIAFGVWRRSTKVPTYDTALVTRGKVVEKVSVTGKVSPVEKADLSFQKSGVITGLNVKVGDHVSRGQVLATLDGSGDLAAVKSAEAQLADLKRGLRPEEYQADQSLVASASTTLANARTNAETTVRDAYVKAQSAVQNYVDQFFLNPLSVNPTLTLSADYNKKLLISTERSDVTTALNNWKNDLSAAGDSLDISVLVAHAETYLETIKNLIGDVSDVVNNLNSTSPGLSPSTMASYISVMNTAESTLTQALTSVNTADTTLKSATASYTQATNQFGLQKAGSSADTIAAQSAKVDQARAEYAKDTLIAPIDGIVTKVVPNLGEFEAAGANTFSIQSDGTFKIEAQVAEADIAKIAIGNSADVTLDAYGQDTVFPAMVTAIDPAETVLEGVPTYKVTLQFVQPDGRIRSGMTANTDILTKESDNVLHIPARAVTDDKGTKSVRIMGADGKTLTTVTVMTGLKGSDGTIEIVSGLNEGDKVVTYEHP